MINGNRRVWIFERAGQHRPFNGHRLARIIAVPVFACGFNRCGDSEDKESGEGYARMLHCSLPIAESGLDDSTRKPGNRLTLIRADYRTTPEINPGLRRGGLTWSFRKQRADFPI